MFTPDSLYTMRQEIFIFFAIFLFCQALPVPEQKDTSKFVYKQDGLPLRSSKLEDELKQLHQSIDKRKIQSSENVIQNQESPIESKIKSTTYLTSKSHYADYEEAIPIVTADTKSNNLEDDDLKNSHNHIQGTEKTKAVLQVVNQRPLSITTTVMSVTYPRRKTEKITKTPLLETIKEEDDIEYKTIATESPTVAAEEAPEMDSSSDDTEKREAGENRLVIDPKDRVMSKGEALVDEELMEFMIKLAEHPKLWTRVRQIFDKIDGEERAPIWVEDPAVQNKLFQEIKPKSEEIASIDNEPKEIAIPNESGNEIMNTEPAIKDKTSESDQLPEVESVSKNNKANSHSQIASLTVTVIPDEHDSHEEIPEIFTEVTIHNTVDHHESLVEPEPSHSLTEEPQQATIKSVNDVQNDKKLEPEVKEQEGLLNNDHTSQPVDISSLNVATDDELDNKSQYVEKELQAVASENDQITPVENTSIPDLEDTSNDLEDMEEQLMALRQSKSQDFTEDMAAQTSTLQSRSM